MTEPVLDVTKKFVRITERRPDGFIEFDFAVGEPELFVEMLLPEAAFHEFCTANQVALLEGERPSGEEQDDWTWRLKQATNQRFK